MGVFPYADRPAELTDVASEHPELVEKLSDAYEEWAEENGVLSPEGFDALRRAASLGYRF